LKAALFKRRLQKLCIERINKGDAIWTCVLEKAMVALNPKILGSDLTGCLLY